MDERDLAVVPEGLRRLVANEGDPATLTGVAKFLKATRRYILLAWFTEQLLRRTDDLKLWHLHAQALVELGFLSAASEVLHGVRDAINNETPNQIAVDLLALDGRIAKQRMVEAQPGEPKRQEHFAAAVEHYRSALRRAAQDSSLRYFPGVNLVALFAQGRRLGLDMPPDSDPEDMARSVRADLDAVSERESGYHWWQATLAECALALGDAQAFASAVRTLVETRKTQVELDREQAALNRITAAGYFTQLPSIDPFAADAFVLASFHRQLVEVWDVDRTRTADYLTPIMGLRQALLQRRGGSLEFDKETLQSIQRLDFKEEKVLGDVGPMPFRWVLQGIERARSVGAVMQKRYGEWKRIGTGFLVSVDGMPEGQAFLTNYHVAPTLPGGGLMIRFEALDPEVVVKAKKIMWQSEPHDASLVLLARPVKATPLCRAAELPKLMSEEPEVRVYVIGHSSGQELTMSLQDNELLDHEGDPDGDDGTRLRLHYRAPTSDGNSGSPVFSENGWEPIALHHGYIEKSTETTLTGYKRYNRANEGISLASIGNALSKATTLRLRMINEGESG